MPDSTYISPYWREQGREFVSTGIMRKHQSRSKYEPHQGKREIARRKARAR
jgi:hypothetical protein